MHSFVTGVVRYRGVAWKLTVPSELLVLDAVAWARSQAAYYREDAELAETEGDPAAAAESREVAQEIELWLQSPDRVVKSVPLLALRQTVKPHVVEVEDLISYLIYLRKRHRSEREQPVYSFVLDIQEESCTLAVLPRFRAQARYTGRRILGVIEEEHTLQAQAKTALSEAEMSDADIPIELDRISR